MSKSEKAVKLGKDLRSQREAAGLKAKDATEALKSHGFDISIKALYSYETGERTPNADIFMALCDVYKTSDILSTYGYINPADTKTPSTSEPAEGEYNEYIDLLKRLPVEQRIEVKGYIKHLVYEYEAAEAAKQITEREA